MKQALERLRDAMEAEGVLELKRVVFDGKTAGFKVRMEDGREGAGLSPRGAIDAANMKVAA